jgi:hypothetical protein
MGARWVTRQAAGAAAACCMPLGKAARPHRRAALRRMLYAVVASARQPGTLVPPASARQPGMSTLVPPCFRPPAHAVRRRLYVVRVAIDPVARPNAPRRARTPDVIADWRMSAEDRAFAMSGPEAITRSMAANCARPPRVGGGVRADGLLLEGFGNPCGLRVACCRLCLPEAPAWVSKRAVQSPLRRLSRHARRIVAQ